MGALLSSEDATVSNLKQGVRRVYMFHEGTKDQRTMLGGKGANLSEMTNLGLPVPPGFILSTQCCQDYFATRELPLSLMVEVKTALRKVEQKIGKTFGDPQNPLLLSVRSGAPTSMPGMMDTVLNLGMNDTIAKGMAESSGNPRWAYDTQRRFLQMFSTVVQGRDGDQFEKAITVVKESRGVKDDVELTADDMKELVQRFKVIDPEVPDDPFTQLQMAIEAVFSSWGSPRAQRYRSMNNIPDEWGTAVNLQSMVFGNMNSNSGTGVAFSRHPATGANVFFGEFLENAAGEDVVSGVRTPKSLDELKERWPEVYEELFALQRRLELHYRDMQDIEFTIEDGKLWMLQCRIGKRTAAAAVRMAVEMQEEGMLSVDEALLRVPADKMDFFLHPSIDPKVYDDDGKSTSKYTVLASGLPASPGAATGEIVFTSDEAEKASEKGKKVILVRKETSPEDVHGLKAAEGVLTQLGGMTSHAAVVARGMGKCCVSGCGEVLINKEEGTLTCRNGVVLRQGDTITLDGTKGNVFTGDVPRVEASEDANFQTILGWADRFRELKLMVNAETPEDVNAALKWGAEGIGLVRTEHMFFQPERIDVMRAMILSESEEERKPYLDKLFVFQKEDLYKIMKTLDGKPAKIRTLDPPLHEFLPNHGKSDDEHIKAIAEMAGKTPEAVRKVMDEMQEANPMLGLRGCRLGIVYPDVTAMQARAIVSAAMDLKNEGYHPRPEIMIPLIASSHELTYIVDLVRTAVEQELDRYSTETKRAAIDCKLGTMIELPRACIVADKLAETGIRFMSFGTNDLTQTCWGLSRDDAPRFIPQYRSKNILSQDPFISLDQVGVGALMEMTIMKARRVNNQMELGICGEHGGDPKSVEYCHRQGLNYVSCSPFRLPIARVAAAQAAIRWNSHHT